MALLLKHSVFFHIGRTAGNSVRAIVARAGLDRGEVGGFHDTPARVHFLSPEVDDAFSFTFVRHPLSWLKSHWAHGVQFGFDSDFDLLSRSARFDRFLENYLEQGWDTPVSRHFRPYLDGCRFVGRMENLASDLSHALVLAGEIDEDVCIDTSIIAGVSLDINLHRAAKAPLELLERLMEREEAFCQAFGYDSFPESLIGEPEFPHLHFFNVGPTAALLSGDANIEKGLHLIEPCLAEPAAHYREVEEPRIIWGNRPTRCGAFGWLKLLEGMTLTGKSVLVLKPHDWALVLHCAGLGARSVVTVIEQPKREDFLLSKALYEEGATVDLVQSLDQLASFGVFDIVFLETGLDEQFGSRNLALWASHFVKPGGRLLARFAEFSLPGHNAPMELLTGAWPEACQYGDTVYLSRAAILELLTTLGFQKPDSLLFVPEINPLDAPKEFDSLVRAHLLEKTWSALFGDTFCSAIRSLSDASSYHAKSAEWELSVRRLWGAPTPVTEELSALAGVAKNALVERDDALRESAKWRSAVADREAELIKTINQRESLQRDLVERTEELVRTREELRERTEALERMVAQAVGDKN